MQSLKWFGKTLALVALLGAATADVSDARPGGGGGRGGGGGFSRGGGGYGGRGGYGGYGRGYGGYGGYWGGYGLGLGLGVGLGYPYGGGYYGDGYYGSSPYYYGDSSPSNVVPQYQSATPMLSSAPAVQPARITVRVPDPNATVLFDGAATTTKGTVRDFDTPPLSQGDYSYQITAKWMENGKEMTKTQTVHVIPGAQAIVNFLPS